MIDGAVGHVCSGCGCSGRRFDRCCLRDAFQQQRTARVAPQECAGGRPELELVGTEPAALPVGITGSGRCALCGHHATARPEDGHEQSGNTERREEETNGCQPRGRAGCGPPSRGASAASELRAPVQRLHLPRLPRPAPAPLGQDGRPLMGDDQPELEPSISAYNVSIFCSAPSRPQIDC
jgi:hypothetical protein